MLIPMDGRYVTRGTRRFAGRFASFAGRFANVSRVSHRGVRTFHAPFAAFRACLRGKLFARYRESADFYPPAKFAI